MTEHHFETPRPVELHVEIGRGSVQVDATDTTESHVEVTGRDADRVLVEQHDDRLSVVGPRARGGFLGGESRLDVRIVVPRDSSLAIRTGSADIDVDGVVATAQLRSGSGGIRLGTLTGPGLVETGSGDVHVERVGAELRVKSGSGDVTVDHTEAALSISTGSGDVAIGTAAGPSVVKTGSGDLSVAESLTDVTLTTGSGDLVVSAARNGRVSAQGRLRRRPGGRPGRPPGVDRRVHRLGLPALRDRERRRGPGRRGPPRGPRPDRQRGRPAHPRLTRPHPTSPPAHQHRRFQHWRPS